MEGTRLAGRLRGKSIVLLSESHEHFVFLSLPWVSFPATLNRYSKNVFPLKVFCSMESQNQFLPTELKTYTEDAQAKFI